VLVQLPFYILQLALQILCNTVITREFIMNYALVNFLVVNRVIVLSIYLFVAESFSAKMIIIRKKKNIG